MSVLFFQNKFYPKAKQGQNFDQEFSFHHEVGVAFDGEGGFFASGINHGGNTHFIATGSSPSITLNEWVTKSFGDTAPTSSSYVPGTYFKRIWRPGGGPWHKLNSQEKLNQSFVSLRILLNKLENLFEVVEPSEENKLTYGHRIREIILLACMEVESSWSAVLKENEYALGRKYTTNDYAKLLPAMFLDGYELSLQQYPNFPAFMPFKNWDKDNPTESLAWYDAYNKTKHDREENLKLATLNNAIWSVGAAVVVFHAQFGMSFGGIGSYEQKTPLIRNMFKINPTELKKYEKEYYIPKLAIEPGPPPSISYLPSLEPTLLNYPF